MESGQGYGEGYCRSCGRRINTRDRYCQYCGTSNSILDTTPGFRIGAGLAVMGGHFLIISAVLSLLSIIPLLDAANSDFTFGYLILGDVLGGLLEIGLVALAVLAIVGGLAAHAEGNYTLAFVGGLASVFSIGGAVGLAGLVMIRASRSDFKSTKSESGSGLGPQEPRDPTQSWQAGGEEASPKDSLQKSLFIGR